VVGQRRDRRRLAHRRAERRSWSGAPHPPFSKEKLAFAVQNGREHVIDDLLYPLEERLDPRRLVRIHVPRSSNVGLVHARDACGDGSVIVRVKDEIGSEAPVETKR
jgi:DNA-binding LytR/AlgR family response regulator